jgi:DmsE family decaheme c-type cytochrome
MRTYQDPIRPAAHLIVAFFIAAGLAVLAVGAEQSGAPPIDDETCLGCHEGVDATLSGSPHALSSTLTKPAVVVACVSCHWGAQAHIEDPSPSNITNPGTADTKTVTAACEKCHVAHQELDNIGFDPHLGKDLSCASCHSVHKGNEGLLLDRNLDFCGQCHVGLAAGFRRRSTHPVAEANVTCLSCHDFTGGKEPTFGHGPSANCYQCHPEQSGPYVFEHEATSSFSPEGDGCTACHSPHGSANDRLLTEPGSLLCQQCHGTPPLHQTFHGGLGSQYPCMDCHTDIHGSNDNINLLDANLGSRISGGPPSCYCHGVDD